MPRVSSPSRSKTARLTCDLSTFVGMCAGASTSAANAARISPACSSNARSTSLFTCFRPAEPIQPRSERTSMSGLSGSAFQNLRASNSFRSSISPACSARMPNRRLRSVSIMVLIPVGAGKSGRKVANSGRRAGKCRCQATVRRAADEDKARRRTKAKHSQVAIRSRLATRWSDLACNCLYCTISCSVALRRAAAHVFGSQERGRCVARLIS